MINTVNTIEEKIKEWIYSQKENIINDLIRLVKIESVSHPDDAVYPFGQKCRDVLDEYEKTAKNLGLHAKNFSYACVGAGLENPDDIADCIGIWSHADVVPVGEGWTYPPFEGIYENGLVIGRGAQDNKCSSIAGLYILKCIDTLKIPLKEKYIWFAGCSEECGMQDIDLFLENHSAPKLNLVADCGFPVCIGEKTIPARDITAPVVQCLTDCYNRLTNGNAQPYVIGGSTYASKLPNAYPYGIILGGKEKIRRYLPDGHGDYHQPDEAVDIDKLLDAMVIYAISIIELDKTV